MPQLAPNTRLVDVALSDTFRRILLRRRPPLATIGDLQRIGAYRFAMTDGVGVGIFREATALLRSGGCAWRADPRLDKRYAVFLDRGAERLLDV